MISIHKVLQVFEKWFWQLWCNPTLKCKLWPLVYRLETALSAIICLSTCRDWSIYFWGLSHLATLCGTSTGNQLFCHPCCLAGREGCGRQRCLYTPCSVALFQFCSCFQGGEKRTGAEGSQRATTGRGSTPGIRGLGWGPMANQVCFWLTCILKS